MGLEILLLLALAITFSGSLKRFTNGRDAVIPGVACPGIDVNSPQAC